MAGYYGEEKFTGPHRDTQFDTQTLEPPLRITGERTSSGAGGEALSAGYYPPTAAQASNYMGGTPSSGQTPINSTFDTQPNLKGDINSGCMPTWLVITSLIFRVAAVVSLIVGLAVLASSSYTSIDMGLHYSFSSFTSTKYAVGAAIIGVAYSIYETVSTAVRLAMGRPLLPGNLSHVISYIGDQVVIVVVLTSASAAATTFTDLRELLYADSLSYCDVLNDVCKQGAGATAVIFLGFVFLAASLVISSFCFYRNKT